MGDQQDKRPLVPNRRLYGLLDLDHHTTSDDVVIAFEKVSLREQFHQAYVVLSEPNRKLMYDLGGERMVDYVLSKSWGPLIPWLGYRWALRLYNLLLIVGAALLLIFFAFLAVKVDDVVSWSWAAVMSPLLIILVGVWIIAVLAIIAVFARKIPESEKEGCLFDYGPSFLNWITASCYIAFASLLAVGLTDSSLYDLKGNYMNVFLLLLFGDVVSLLASCAWRHPRKIRRALSAHYPNSSPPAILVYGFVVLVLFYILLAVARWVVIGLKIDGDLDEHSWYRIFIPILVRAFFGIIETVMYCWYMRVMRMRSGCEVFFALLGAIFMNSLVIVSLYMLAVKLEGKLMTMANTLVPMFVFCGYLVLASIFTAAFLMWRMRRLEDKALHARMLAARQREYTDPTATPSQGGNAPNGTGVRNRRGGHNQYPGSLHHAPTYQHGSAAPNDFEDLYDDDGHLSFDEEDEEGYGEEEEGTEYDSEGGSSEEGEEEEEYSDEEMEEIEVDDDDDETDDGIFTEKVEKSPPGRNKVGSRQSTPRGPHPYVPHQPTHVASPVIYRERPQSVPPQSNRPAVSPMRPLHPPTQNNAHGTASRGPTPRNATPSSANNRNGVNSSPTKRDKNSSAPRTATPNTGRPRSIPRNGTSHPSSRASSRHADRT